MIMPCDFQQEPQFEKKMKKEKKKLYNLTSEKGGTNSGRENKPIF